MLGLRPRPHGSIRSFALPAPAVMVAWWVVMLARGPPIRRRSEVGMRTPSPTTRPFHHTPHQPPLPTPPHTLPGNARGAQGGWRTLGWRALSASGAPPRRTRSRGTTVRSAPPLPQPCQATPFPHAWLIAPAVCAAGRDAGAPRPAARLRSSRARPRSSATGRRTGRRPAPPSPSRQHHAAG